MPSAVPIRQDISAAELRHHAKIEPDGRASRRMLALAAVLEGASREAAARLAGMDRQSLRDRVHCYNEDGIDGLHDRPHTGRPPRLSEGQMAAFKALVLREPDIEKDGVSAWTAKDLCRIVEERYQVSYSENGMLKLLHSLDLSWQKTRPAHPKADRRAQEDFKKKSRGLIAEAQTALPEVERIEVWLQDEARIGQTGRNCRRWYQRGSRPTGLKDQRHTAVYLFGAACPERDAAFGLVLPLVSTGAMQAFLDQLSEQVATGAHALLVMDRAGWHCANDLVIPENLTPIFLPPYSPELNAIERLWLYLKERFLSHRIWADYDAIVDGVCQAWQRVTGEAGRIKSLCSMEWATTVEH